MGGPSRAQRKHARRREARAAARAGEGGQGGAPQGTHEGPGEGAGGGGPTEGLGGDGKREDGDDAEEPEAMDEEEQVHPFVQPSQPRQVIAARAQLLDSTVKEMRLAGATDEQIAPVVESLEKARRLVKEAGGATAGRLRTEVMAEAKRIAKREAAVERGRRRRDELQAEVEKAMAEVAKQDRAIELLSAKVDYSKARYAQLVAQQASECTLVRAEEVHRAVAALRGVGDTMGEDLRGHIDVLSQAVAPLYVDKNAVARDVLDEACVDLSDGGGEEEDELEYEAVITGDMLHEVHLARAAMQEARRTRNEKVLEACYSGSSVQDVTEEMGRVVEEAIKRLASAKASLARAKDAARRRIGRERAEEEERIARQEAEEAAAAARREAEECDEQRRREQLQQQQRQQQRPCEQQGGGERRQAEAAEEEEEEEVVPCPPPSKWRRANSASTSSNRTVEEETPALIAASDHVIHMGNMEARGRSSDRTAEAEKGRGSVAGVAARACGGGGGGSDRCKAAWATRALEALGGARAGARSAVRAPPANLVGEQPTQEAGGGSTAMEVICEGLADGAVDIVQAAITSRAATNAARADRRARAASAGARGRSRSEGAQRGRPASLRRRPRRDGDGQ